MPYEWVYNEADIDASRVVWARSMGPDADRRLVKYFHTRRIWLLDANAETPRVVPYPRPRKETLPP